MHLAILSRNRSLHSIKRLLHESRKAGAPCAVLDPLRFQIAVSGNESDLFYSGRVIPRFGCVLPRIGASITGYGIAVVKQFESIGVRVVNSSQAIADSRNKLRSFQVLSQSGVAFPPSILARSSEGLRNSVKALGGMPVVLKLLQGTQGLGVMLVHSQKSLESVLETLWELGQEVIIQKFISTTPNQDYRVFIVGNEVVGTMVRTARAGEFRSNVHRGAETKAIDLPNSHKRIALKAARALHLEIAGIDLIDSEAGPLVLEANSSPGFEGLERATGENIAAKIISHMLRTRSM